ncbi:hypothetical protein GCM10027035_49560 [Emticicia sediminis]
MSFEEIEGRNILVPLCGKTVDMHRLIGYRASLVALPYKMRTGYIQILDRITDVGTKQLVVTLEYFPLINSAPFYIKPSEIENCYGAGHIVNHVEQPNLLKHGMVRKWS